MQAENFPLLRTKLHRPKLASDHLPRPHLIEFLNHNLQRKLTLVSAPAGFGKTTLLCQWLSAAPMPSAWLSLDRGDNDLLTFLKYFVAAVQTLFPETCSTTQSLLYAPQTPPADYLFTTLINELVDLPENFILALDDYHYIESPDIHHMLVKLLDYWPPTLHLALASRIDPPFPLSRLRSRGQMIEIRSAALRFSVAETADFLTTTVGSTPLPSNTATILAARTEGWIVGLRLAAISLPNHPDPEAFLAAFDHSVHRPIMEYLLDEVLDRQPVEVQEWLIKTSILDRFCLALCQAVIAADGLDQNPQSLFQTNLLLIGLDEAGEWYRYHHLFQELLQHRLKERFTGAEINQLHCRAGNWLAQQGYVDDALRHFLAADDPLAAAQVVEQNYQAFINREEWPVVRRWLKRLPPTLVEQRPALLLARCWHLHHEFKLAAITPLLDQAERLLESPGLGLPEAEQQRLHGEINTHRSQIVYFQGDYETSQSYARQALDQLPDTAIFARSLALLYLGTVSQVLGQTNEALQLLQAVIDAEPEHNALTMRVLLTIVFIHRFTANFYQLQQAGQWLLHAAETIGLQVSVTWASCHLGLLFYEWNELDAAEHHFITVVKHRYQAHHVAFRDSLMGLALIYLVRNDTGKLEQSLDELEAFTQQVGSPIFWSTYHSFVAYVRLRQGNPDIAANEAEIVLADDIGVKLPFLEYPTLTHIKILLSQGGQADLLEATALLDQVQPVIETNHNTLRLIEVLALRALLYQATGQTVEAVAHLENALRLAQPGHLIRTFVDLGQPMALLLRQVARHNFEPAYVQRLLAAFDHSSDGGAGPHSLPADDDSQVAIIEPLTDREFEVLELLVQRYSNKEIGAKLFISPLTVKKHTAHIYQKLQVKSRQQAMVRAKQLKLFDNGR